MKNKPGLTLTRSNAELLQALEDQRCALEASASSYDAGKLWEAPRLATTVYNLVNDSPPKTRSVLTQIGLRSQLGFFSSIRVKEPGVITLAEFGAPLATARASVNLVDENGELFNKIEYAANLDDFIPPARGNIKFSDWWEEIVFVNKSGAGLSRHKLVYHLRSKDGGSHFDGEMPESPYTNLKDTPAAIVSSTSEDGEEIPCKYVNNGHLATMRQIAWELEETLRSIPRTS